MTQEPELIVTINTPDATYHERVLGEPIRRYRQQVETSNDQQ